MVGCASAADFRERPGEALYEELREVLAEFIFAWKELTFLDLIIVQRPKQRQEGVLITMMCVGPSDDVIDTFFAAFFRSETPQRGFNAFRSVHPRFRGRT